MCWEITSRCNLLCPHCFTYPPVRPELPLTRMVEIVEEMASAGVRRVLLTGGEPLMSPHLDALCHALTDNSILIDVNTNATMANARRLRELASAGVKELTVSLDGGSADDYERCRPGAKFDTVLGNIRTAIALGFSVDLTFVPTALNFHAFQEVARLAEKLKASSLTVAGLVAFQRARDNQALLALHPDQVEELCLKIDLMRNELHTPIWSNRLRTPKPTRPCVAGKNIVGIDASGYMHPCPLYVLPFTRANDLTQHPFVDILRDQNFYPQTLTPNGMVECFNCPHAPNCPGGCLGVKRKLELPAGGPDPLCAEPARMSVHTYS